MIRTKCAVWARGHTCSFWGPSRDVNTMAPVNTNIWCCKAIALQGKKPEIRQYCCNVYIYIYIIYSYHTVFNGLGNRGMFTRYERGRPFEAAASQEKNTHNTITRKTILKKKAGATPTVTNWFNTAKTINYGTAEVHIRRTTHEKQTGKGDILFRFKHGV